MLTSAERVSRRDAARDVLEAAGDDEGLALYWWSYAGEMWNSCRAEETTAACEHGLVHARAAGRFGRIDDFMWWIRSAYVFGPAHVDEAIVRVAALGAEAGDSVLLRAGADATQARLLSMQGEIASARELQDASRKTYADAGMTVTEASVALHRSWIEERAGDYGAKEAALRESLAVLERLGERAFRGTVCADLAHCLYLQGRVGEIPELLDVVRTTSTPDDVINFVYLDALDGVVHASEGRFAEAEAAGRRARELAETTDYFFSRAWVRVMLADTLVRSDRPSEASDHAAQALAILAAKGDAAGSARVREHLDRLGIVAAS